MARSVLISLLVTIFFQCTIHAKVNPEPVQEFTKDNGKAFFKKDTPHYIVLFESKESDDYSDHFEEFEIAAAHFEGKVKFVYFNTDVEENWDTIEYLGLIAEDIPTLLFIDLSHGLEKYKAEFTEITRKNIISFVQDCVDGKSVAFLKSEDIPEGWDSKPLKQLVGKNFEQVIFKRKQTAFVIFYASWCQACKNAMPEIERLAEMFADNKDVLIGRMDATANEIPRMPVLDVPTFALFIKGDTKPIYYTDDRRNAEDFQRFINMKLKEAGLKAGKEDENVDEDIVAEEKVEKKAKKGGKKEEPSKKTKATEKSKEKLKKAEKTDTKKGTESKTVKDEGTKKKTDKKTTTKTTKKTTKEGEEKTKGTKKTTKEAEKKVKTGKETTKEDGEKKATEKKATKGKAEEKSKKAAKKSKSGKKAGKDEL